MSTISIENHPVVAQECSKEQDKSTSRFQVVMAKFGRIFWTYTEDAGESSTKSYEGIL